MLLLVKYCDERAMLESTSMVRKYKEVVRVHERREDAYFHIARYYDKIQLSLVNWHDNIEKAGYTIARFTFTPTCTAYFAPIMFKYMYVRSPSDTGTL